MDEDALLLMPPAPLDPLSDVAAAIDELERLGMPAEKHTILIAGGLARRAGRRELEAVLRPIGARDFRGTVAVHDATGDELRVLELAGAPAVRIHPALLDADLV